MGIGDRIADGHESPEELAQSQDSLARVAPRVVHRVESSDGLLEAVTTDEPHRVVGATVRVAAQAIDRDDPRMLQFPGELRLQQEPGPAARIMGELAQDLLQGHVAAELFVAGEVDATQAPLGVRPDDAKARCGGGGGAYRAATARVGGLVRTGGDDPSEGGPELGIGDAPHVLPG